jgi:hypothetical protein
MHAGVAARPSGQLPCSCAPSRISSRGFAADGACLGASRGFNALSSSGLSAQSAQGFNLAAMHQALRRCYSTWTSPLHSAEGGRGAWSSYSVATYTPKLPSWVRTRLPEMPEGGHPFLALPTLHTTRCKHVSNLHLSFAEGGTGRCYASRNACSMAI